jgi:hypothetical protein
MLGSSNAPESMAQALILLRNRNQVRTNNLLLSYWWLVAPKVAQQQCIQMPGSSNALE